MPPRLMLRRQLGRLLTASVIAAALLLPAAASAQQDITDDPGAVEDVPVQIEGTSANKRVGGAQADCRAFENGTTFKRGGQPGKGVVKRDFGAGNGDRGALVWHDPATGTGLFWTDGAGYLSVSIASLAGDAVGDELSGSLFEGAPRSIDREVLLDRLVEQAAAADVTTEQLRETFEDIARDRDGGCLWSSRFVPRKSDRGRVSPFWLAMMGEAGSEPPTLQVGRFQVEVTWQDADGGEQMAVQSFDAMSSEDDGPGYFFSVEDTDLVVKVLDGCSSNDRFWLLAASATEVDFTLTVTDTESGQSRAYANPLVAVPAITDTSAFATCP